MVILSTPDAKKTAAILVLSNAVSASTAVIQKIAGNDIADGVRGESLSSKELNNMLAAKIGSYVKSGGKS